MTAAGLERSRLLDRASRRQIKCHEPATSAPSAESIPRFCAICSGANRKSTERRSNERGFYSAKNERKSFRLCLLCIRSGALRGVNALNWLRERPRARARARARSRGLEIRRTLYRTEKHA
jgi:hypothetical protein